ncbi:MAG: amino acid/amide transporter substrate-binding protein, family, partial [Deltaproteobacteria bacterium]|nr:amino acid/amide transporter substrate-binding protein, family [Deltaproteobacteria bacterium]
MRKTAIAVTAVLLFATTAVAADTIKIGAMYPLSGRAEALGRECRLGAEQAVEEINAKGGVLGKKLELSSADDKANVQEGVNLAKRYIQKDGVNFLFGTVSSAVALAVAEVAKQEKVVTMITIGSTDTVTKEKWNRYTFRSGMCNSQFANSLALYTAKKYPKLTKFYNIGPDYEY